MGPGETLPSGYRVLPGKNVTTNQEASDPALGKVVPVTASELAAIARTVSNNQVLAQGYNTLYQGQSATGVSPGVDTTVTGVDYGNLTAVTGAGAEPGSPTAFLPPGRSPKFPTPNRGLVQAGLFNFRARVAGAVVFDAQARDVAHAMGRSNAIRADQGQPITIGSIGRTGNAVTINSPAGGPLTIGRNFVAGDNATVLGDGTTQVVLGDYVTVGSGAVVVGTSLGSGSSVGPRAYLRNSSFPAGTSIPAGAIYIDNTPVGSVEW